MLIEDYFTLEELDILNSLLTPLSTKMNVSGFPPARCCHDLATLYLHEKIKSLRDYKLSRSKQICKT
jgi:hypothetical protein